jgi:CubicO group peptidase (beta-lactamase class C family)
MLRKPFIGLSVVLASLALVPLLARSQAPAGRPDVLAALTAFEPTLAAEFARDGIGGASIGVVSGATLIWSRHYGFADAEAGRVPTNDSAYRIGSITKQFTALALLQLVEQGVMRLSDPIEKYVPEVRSVQNATAGAPPITLLQVATMMSGLSREPGCAEHSVGPVSIWQKKVVDCLPQTRYQFEPGTQYLYSNIGYATLGVAIERAARTPYVDVVASRIFQPLAMSRSAFEPTPIVRQNLAHGYQRDRTTQKGSRTVPDQKLDGRGYRVPNGAIFSTVNDLARFVAWELGAGPSGILTKTTQDANYLRVYSANVPANGQPSPSGYGLGFQMSRRGSVVMLGHGGSTEGYHAAALFHRASKLGVVVLRGCDSCPFDASPVAARILERIAADPGQAGR